MIKKTLYFGNPVYLSLKNAQLMIKLPEVVRNDTLPESFKRTSEVTKPIEDIGVVVLDHKQITISSGVLEALLENNCAVITCNSKSMPEGFTRDREGIPPNNLLNYGYAILRAVVARSLVASGLLPTLGIHHHNRYNAYCLADDIMEPYRPYVDQLVCGIIKQGVDYAELTRELKAQLLTIPVLETYMSGKRSPLMVAVGQTTASLYKCFSGELRRISYPEM